MDPDSEACSLSAKIHAHPPIAVLTLNPSLDVSYEVPQLIPDQKSRATDTRYDPGGNGVNVGRTLRTLGVRAACFTRSRFRPARVLP